MTNYQGKLFTVLTFRTIVLYPNQSGTLTLPSLEIAADIIVRPRTFFDFDSTRKLNIASKPVNLNVRDLPTAGRPGVFSGAVGSFRISSEISVTDLTVGDTFTYKIQITGNGNFKHFDPPPFPQLPFLRHIDPEIVTDSKLERDKVTGAKTIRYPVIVTEEGEFDIPPLVFAYYDPERNTYLTLQTSSYRISVAPSDMRTIPITVAQQDVTAEGADIYYIYRTAHLNSIFLIPQSLLYWLLWLIILLTFPFAFYYRKERAKWATDINYVRQKQARKILHKYMNKATQSAKQGNMEFYSYVNTGLANYLTDNLRIPRGSTTESIINEMKTQQYPPDIVQKVKEIINSCLEARFMPGGFDKVKIDQDFEKLQNTISVISRLKKTVKSNKEFSRGVK